MRWIYARNLTYARAVDVLSLVEAKRSALPRHERSDMPCFGRSAMIFEPFITNLTTKETNVSFSLVIVQKTISPTEIIPLCLLIYKFSLPKQAIFLIPGTRLERYPLMARVQWNASLWHKCRGPHRKGLRGW